VQTNLPERPFYLETSPVLNNTLIAQFMTEFHLPGLAVGIQRGSDLLHEGYYGLANLEHNVPISAVTVFEIASVTKLFTSQAILRLVQDGRIGLDDPVSRYVTNLPETWQPITIRHCLAHQSGIPNYTAVKRYWQITREDKSHEDVLALVRDLPLNFAPGTRHAYDNTGFYLLGMVIEMVTQQPYGEFLRETIFAPLNMTHTLANDYDRIVPHRAQGYTYGNDSMHNKRFYDISNTFSAGILLSTVRDLLKWAKALHSDAILNPASRDLWWTPHLSQARNEQTSSYPYTLTLGWFIVDDPIVQFYGHNGGIEGFASAFLHVPSSDISAVVLTNCNFGSDPHKLALDLLRDLRLV
jgi:CubicO group peptidase (beta-lactamase class C family)